MTIYCSLFAVRPFLFNEYSMRPFFHFAWKGFVRFYDNALFTRWMFVFCILFALFAGNFLRIVVHLWMQMIMKQNKNVWKIGNCRKISLFSTHFITLHVFPGSGIQHLPNFYIKTFRRIDNIQMELVNGAIHMWKMKPGNAYLFSLNIWFFHVRIDVQYTHVRGFQTYERKYFYFIIIIRVVCNIHSQIFVFLIYFFLLHSKNVVICFPLRIADR